MVIAQKCVPCASNPASNANRWAALAQRKRKAKVMSEYVPFGDEWKKEVMHLKKSEIVDMLAKALRETASRPTKRALDSAETCPNCSTKWQFHDPRVCSIKPPSQ